MQEFYFCVYVESGDYTAPITRNGVVGKFPPVWMQEHNAKDEKYRRHITLLWFAKITAEEAEAYEKAPKKRGVS